MSVPTLDLPQARTAPSHVVRGLRELDPTAVIVHLGGPTWVVGKVRPNSETRRQAIAMLDQWTTAVSEGARMSETGKMRVRFALLALQGFRPVERYRIQGEPDSRIVHDFAESRYRWLHETDAQLFAGFDEAQERKRAEARAEIADLDRAKDAYKYAFTSSFGAAVSSVGTRTTPVRSGFVRHSIPSNHAA